MADDDSGSAASLFATLKKIVELIDVDGSGQIDMDEFKPVYMRLNPLGTDEDVKRVFNSIDDDGSGEISLSELAAHYGIKVGTGGSIVGDVDTSGMSDNQLIELMHLNSIASDTRAEAVRKEKAEAAKAARLLAQKAAEEQARIDKLAQKPRAIEMRRGSITLSDTGSASEASKVAEFFDACTLGDNAEITQALQEGVDPRVCDENGQSALHKVARLTGAAACKAAELIVGFKGLKVDFDCQDRNGKTAAHYAAEYGNVAMLDWLLKQGANARLTSSEGWTLLHEAAFKGSRPCIESVLRLPKEKGPDVNLKDHQGRTALHIAAYRSKDEDTLQLLISNGADPELQDSRKFSAMQLAEKSGIKAMARFQQAFDKVKLKASASQSAGA